MAGLEMSSFARLKRGNPSFPPEFGMLFFSTLGGTKTGEGE
jgi:hypothetical protein